MSKGAGQSGAGDYSADAGRSECKPVSSGNREGNTLSPRREYPDLATLEPADDDEEVFGEAWPLVKEWRELKDSHPNEGTGSGVAERRSSGLLEVELALAGGARADPAAGAAAPAGFRPQRADKLAPDRPGRHPEGAGQAGTVAHGQTLAHPGALAEVAGASVAAGRRGALSTFVQVSFNFSSTGFTDSGDNPRRGYQFRVQNPADNNCVVWLFRGFPP